MPKPYAVTPRLQDGRGFYIATFRDATGNRVTKGLRTNDPGKAKEVCGGLERLWNGKVREFKDAPVDVHADSVRLYFGDHNELAGGALPADAEDVSDLLAKVRAELDQYQPHFRDTLMPVLIDRARLRRDNERLRTQVTAQKQDNADLSARVEQLEGSVIVKTMESAARSLPLPEALQKYETALKAMHTEKHVKDMVGRARVFIDTMPAETRAAAVTSSQIAEFVGKQSTAGDPRYKATRYKYWRVRLGAFFNWAAKEFGYVSQMIDVSDVSADAVDREKGDIHWHELAEVEAAVKAAPDAYWKALIGTLAYAGLRLSELIWLRKSDVKLTDAGGTIWVTTVEDNEDPEIVHKLKTARSKRAVNVHAKYLLPLLEDYIAAGLAGEYYFFPVPGTARRRKRGDGNGSAERWLLNTLSTALRGHKGGAGKKGQTKRPATDGKLLAGMNAKSLRRTFGSLLLRSGKSIEAVAAAMGNTAVVCDKHYARLKGCETKMDF